MRFLYHPDTVVTAGDLESLPEDHLAEIPIPGVEGSDFDPGIIRKTLLQAAVDQKCIKGVTDTTRNSYSVDYTLVQLRRIRPSDLEATVNELLANQAAMILGNRSRIVCLDFVVIHYHGHKYTHPAEVCHTTPRVDRSRCHRYLPAFALYRAKPLILAVTVVRSDESTSDAVERVLDHAVALPFDVASLLVDRDFYDEASITALRETAPVLLPVIRRGKRMAAKLETEISYWTEYTMHDGNERELRFPLAVCVYYRQGKRGNYGLLVRAYAAVDQPDHSPKQIEARYRKRSAIETSFRTMRVARAKTSTRDPTIRWMYVAVSFLLRNLWLLVPWAVLAPRDAAGEHCPSGSASRSSASGSTTPSTMNSTTSRKRPPMVSGFRRCTPK